MQMRSFKNEFNRSLTAHGETLHFAAHSHHLWPDATREAQKQYWDDAAANSDHKWDKIFGEVQPAVQQHITNILNLPDPTQIVFAPNTHEFVLRLLSCLPQDRPVRILSSDSEFHSFRRQLSRLSESDSYEWIQVECEPFDTYPTRLKDTIAENQFDLIYLSQVYFNSGYVLEDLNDIVQAVTNSKTLIAIDGYHGFCARPTDLSAVADRVFYIAGGYKYAMSGEGCCFMTVPNGCEFRPRNTGWYASFETLANDTDIAGYAGDGQRFAGATFDPSGLYRMRAVFDLWESLNLDIAEIHDRIVCLQNRFIEGLASLGYPSLSCDTLLLSPQAERGHFLTFDVGSPKTADQITRALEQIHVIVDARKSRVRFGFGLYHNLEDIDLLLTRLSQLPIGATP